jgi:HEAT repeat protein
MRTSVWKVTTAAALGLAAVLAFRPLRARGLEPAATVGPEPAAQAAAAADIPALAAPEGHADALVARLRSARSTEAACDALDALGWRRDAAAVAAVVEAFRGRSTVEVKECALGALGHVPGERADDVLVEATHDPQPTVRDAALAALALRDDDLARATVAAVSQSDDASARAGAAVALARARVPGSAPLVDQVIARASAPQQQQILGALGEGGDVAALPTIARFVGAPTAGVRTAALGAAARAGGAAMALVEAAIHRGGDDADAALNALGAVDADDARALLVRTADDPRPAVAAKALETLSSFDGEDVRAAVVMHVGSAHPGVATAAAKWLAARGDGSAVASLVEAAQRADTTSADEAMSALGAVGSGAARDAMRALASRPGVARERALRELAATPDGADEARAIALRMVHDEGGSVASTGLTLLTSDPSPEATQALAEVARTGGSLGHDAVEALGARRDDAALTALLDLSRTGAAQDMRAVALTTLGGQSDPRAVRALLDAAADPAVRDTALASLARTGGAEAERALARAAASSSADERAAAARALVDETPPGLVPNLGVLARDRDESVSTMAFQALRTAAPQEALALATEGLRSSDVAARTEAVSRASQLEPEATRPMLIEALHDADPGVVAAAASALGNAGGSDAQQALLDVLTRSSADDDMRRAAAEALHGMGGAAARDHADLIARWLADEGEGEAEGDESGE